MCSDVKEENVRSVEVGYIIRDKKNVSDVTAAAASCPVSSNEERGDEHVADHTWVAALDEYTALRGRERKNPEKDFFFVKIKDPQLAMHIANYMKKLCEGHCIQSILCKYSLLDPCATQLFVYIREILN